MLYMSDTADKVIYSLCEIIAEKLQSQPQIPLQNLVKDVKKVLKTDSLQEESLILQVNSENATGFQTIVNDGVAYIGRNVIFSDVNPDSLESVLKAVLEEYKKQPPQYHSGNLAANFVGREQDLEKLDKIIKDANQVAISAVAGMGGVGKSELAKQYIRKHQKTYPGGICWLNARDKNFIVQLISFSGVEVDEKLSLENQVQDCYNNWEWQGNVLLVFDDLQDYGQIKDYLPAQSRFKVLITTRTRLESPVVRMDLDVLEPAAALELLQFFVGKDRIAAEQEKAQELCEWLGYLPLGLELVGRYLAKRKISLAEMQKRLEKKSLEHKSLDQTHKEMTAERGVQAAFELSWEALQENPDAQETAYFLSLFALAPIPQELLENANLREDWEDVEDALVELEDLHLVKSTPEEDYLLHSLIREFLHTKEPQFDASQLKQVVGNVMVAKGKEIPENITVDQVTTFSPFIPHLQEVATHLADYLTDEDLITPFNGLASFYYGQGLYNLAEPWLLQGKEIALTRLGNKHADTAIILNNLAGLYSNQGRYEEAEPLFLQAIEIVKIALPDNHPSLAIDFNNLAGLYRYQGRYEEAEPLFLQAIEIDKIALPDNHPSLANYLNNLALLYSYQGRYEEAEPLFLQAIKIVKIALPDNHPFLAYGLNNLALLYSYQGRYEEAEPLFLQAIKIVKIALPDNHPSLANHLNNLADLYESQGRYEEAEPLFLQAIEIDKIALPDNHPELAIDFNNLAGLYRYQGKYEEAEPLFLQAIEIDKIALPDNHPELANHLNNLAGLYESQGKYEEAEPLFLQAIEIDKIALPDNHPSLAIDFNNLAGLYESQGRYEQAEPLFLRAIEIVKISLPDNHPSLATHLNNLALLYKSQGRYEEAEPLCLQAIEIDKISLPENHPELANHLNNLAGLYESQGKYEEAEPLYLQAIEIDKIALPDNHPSLASSLSNLALLYKSQGRYEDAEPLFLQALEIFVNSLGESHPNTQTVQRNLDYFIKQVVKEGREKELSNHPAVQNLIREIKTSNGFLGLRMKKNREPKNKFSALKKSIFAMIRAVIKT